MAQRTREDQFAINSNTVCLNLRLTLMWHLVNGEKPSCPGVQLSMNLLDCLPITVTLDTGLGSTTEHHKNLINYPNMKNMISCHSKTLSRMLNFYLLCWCLLPWMYWPPFCCKLHNWTACICPHLQQTHWTWSHFQFMTVLENEETFSYLKSSFIFLCERYVVTWVAMSA